MDLDKIMNYSILYQFLKLNLTNMDLDLDKHITVERH